MLCNGPGHADVGAGVTGMDHVRFCHGMEVIICVHYVRHQRLGFIFPIQILHFLLNLDFPPSYFLPRPVHAEKPGCPLQNSKVLNSLNINEIVFQHILRSEILEIERALSQCVLMRIAA